MLRARHSSVSLISAAQAVLVCSVLASKCALALAGASRVVYAQQNRRTACQEGESFLCSAKPVLVVQADLSMAICLSQKIEYFHGLHVETRD